MKEWLKERYHRLPIIKELRGLQATAGTIRLAVIDEIVSHELANSPRYRDVRKLNRFEHQVFSQNGEDGIVAEIFRRIGTKDKFFVEFGVGDGLENNTAFLLQQKWRGCWIEGNAACANQIRGHFRKPLGDGRLKLLNSFITAENIEGLFNQLNVPAEFDFLSVDIDRNTYHVWKALSRFKPRVVAVEYNSTFPADVEWVVPYDAGKVWDHTMNYGASLKSFERLGTEAGYALVGCDFSGTNAFFVRTTEKLELFADPFTAEHHFEPSRYWTCRRNAHARRYEEA